MTKKQNKSRPYKVRTLEVLKGTSIMMSGGTPRHLAQVIENGQISNRLAYIPFEHESKSGKKARENFENNLNRHRERVADAILDQANRTDSRGNKPISLNRIYVLDDLTKTSQIQFIQI